MTERPGERARMEHALATIETTPRRYLMSPRVWSEPAASVTVARRTPSMSAIVSWVMGMSSRPTRSRQMSSQRASRSSAAWSRLHAVLWEIWVRKPWA